MQSGFKLVGFIVIWGCTLGVTYWVWTPFGMLAGILFFAFGAGLAGFAGMLVPLAVAKLLNIKIDG